MLYCVFTVSGVSRKKRRNHAVNPTKKKMCILEKKAKLPNIVWQNLQVTNQLVKEELTIFKFTEKIKVRDRVIINVYRNMLIGFSIILFGTLFSFLWKWSVLRSYQYFFRTYFELKPLRTFQSRYGSSEKGNGWPLLILFCLLSSSVLLPIGYIT